MSNIVNLRDLKYGDMFSYDHKHYMYVMRTYIVNDKEFNADYILNLDNGLLMNPNNFLNKYGEDIKVKKIKTFYRNYCYEKIKEIRKEERKRKNNE